MFRPPMEGRSTNGAILIVRQLQDKFRAVNKTLYMAFVDLGKVFDRAHGLVIWWALRKLGVEEWLTQNMSVCACVLVAT